MMMHEQAPLRAALMVMIDEHEKRVGHLPRRMGKIADALASECKRSESCFPTAARATEGWCY